MDREAAQADFEAELAAHFEALCRDLYAQIPIRTLPIGLRFALEHLARQLGVPRPWRVA